MRAQDLAVRMGAGETIFDRVLYSLPSEKEGRLHHQARSERHGHARTRGFLPPQAVQDEEDGGGGHVSELGQDVPGWGAHLQTAPEDQLKVKKALEVYGDVRDRDFYSFSVRFEAIEQAYLGLSNNPGGMGPEALT